MPENTPQTYTPTPWEGAKTYTRNGDLAFSVVFSPAQAGYPTSPRACEALGLSPEEAQANASLIVAAVNSYARHCGPNAIQCAEDDLLGQALDALQGVKTDIESYVSGDWIPDSDEGWLLMCEKITIILSRLSGEGVES